MEVSMPNWLRWILALPAALVAYIASQILVGLLSEELPLPAAFRDWSSQAANSVVGPWALIAAGAAVAPRGRAFFVSVILAVGFGVLTCVVGALAFLDDDPTVARWWLVLSSLLGMATVIVTCVQFQRRGAEERGSESGSPVRPDLAQRLSTDAHRPQGSYSLAAMEREFLKAKRGTPLTSDERAMIADHHSKIAAAEKALQDHLEAKERERAEAHAERAFAEMKRRVASPEWQAKRAKEMKQAKKDYDDAVSALASHLEAPSE
jgi:hypothetical protein